MATRCSARTVSEIAQLDRVASGVDGVQVVSAKMQQITLREFLPILGISEASVRSATPMTNSPQVSVEFAMAGYRFGHDLVPKRMGSLDAVQLFNGKKFFGIAQTGAHPAVLAQ